MDYFPLWGAEYLDLQGLELYKWEAQIIPVSYLEGW